MGEFYDYYRAIEPVRCRELLQEFQVADFPHLKNPKRQSIHRKITQAAFPNSRSASQAITMEQAALVMNKKGPKTSGSTR